eukprot:TRINITY_DN23904_c0_g1_i1.p1 TRINITY_DN23904_c0_g1~~TRINITY_DN23904_c0_g1_i1.p1  ORF type:complete len:904 (+),score=109.16 TRINITY_DN23904_c0_g1_i1:151-2862(+)
MGAASSANLPPQASGLRCKALEPTALLLEWDLADPEESPVTHCEVQLASSWSWSSVAFALEDAVGPRRARPEAPSDLACTARRHNGFDIEWQVLDPPGAAALSCEIQIGGSFAWGYADHGDDEGLPRRCENNIWRARIVGLQGNTAYEVRVRASNAVGEGGWLQQPFKSSDVPLAPAELTCSNRNSDGFDIEWMMPDPDGAPISVCDVEIASSLSWHAAMLSIAPARRNDRWRATVVGLTAATSYDVRVRGRNAAGEGMWTQNRFTTSKPPSTPVKVKCRRRRTDGLDIEWALDDPDGAPVAECEVEVASPLSWRKASLSLVPTRVDDRWHARLAGLAGATSYDVRVRGKNAAGDGPWVQQRFQTSDCPSPPQGLSCTQRAPNELSVRWQVLGVEGAPTLGCEAQIFQNGYWIGTGVKRQGSRPQSKENDHASEEDVDVEDWSATFVGLDGATDYEVRVRACNSVGPGEWCEQSFSTAWTPPAPVAVNCIERLPDKLVLEWDIADPEGAEVTNCELQLAGTMGWYSAMIEAEQKPTRCTGNTWRASITGLPPDADQQLRVRGRNASGPGAWLQQALRTSDRPGPPWELTAAELWVDKISLEWQVQDPVGAPLTSCDVQVRTAMFWSTAAYEIEPRPLGEGRWGAKVAGLTPDTSVEFRIRCVNTCGTGPWSENILAGITPGTPEKPRSFTWRVRPGPHGPRLELAWQVPDPGGAKVTECTLEIAKESMFLSSRWAAPEFDTDGMPKRTQDNQWIATVLGISAGTECDVRIGAQNSIGKSLYYRARFVVPGKPATPSELCRSSKSFISRLVSPRLGANEGVSLQWLVDDSPKAEVLQCDLQVYVSPGWKPAVFLHGEEPNRVSPDEKNWRATVVNLSAGCTYDFRVRAVSAAGEGEWYQQRISV